jgi:hypothetical protein
MARTNRDVLSNGGARADQCLSIAYDLSDLINKADEVGDQYLKWCLTMCRCAEVRRWLWQTTACNIE